jgi:hypothetical protein
MLDGAAEREIILLLEQQNTVIVDFGLGVFHLFEGYSLLNLS